MVLRKSIVTPHISGNLEPFEAVLDTMPREELPEGDSKPRDLPPREIVWTNVFWMTALHLLAIYGLYTVPQTSWKTWIWTLAVYVMSATGVTAGSHRLWAHRSYKATLPLQLTLAVWSTMAGQNSIIEWSRDHRVHHKGSETDADPHNARRGFFFAHCGWLLVRKHPDVKVKGRSLDMSDLYKDPICAFQHKHFLVCVLVLCYAFPAVVPWYFWQESFFKAFLVCSIFRYTLVLHMTWLVNSAAHMWGNKPYDKNINPAENLFVSFAAVGEGFHNYHHTFPQDYSTSELGAPYFLNFTTLFLDIMAFIGLAYDRTKISPATVAKRMQRTGDGSAAFDLLNVGKAIQGSSFGKDIRTPLQTDH